MAHDPSDSTPGNCPVCGRTLDPEREFTRHLSTGETTRQLATCPGCEELVRPVTRQAESGSQSRRVTPSAGTSRTDVCLRVLDSHARWLWLLAILTYVIGDLVTTAVGLRYTSLQETSPIARHLLDRFGSVVLAGLKLGGLGLFAGLWRLLPRPVSHGVPLGLTLIGCVVTLWNTALIVPAVV